MFAVFDAFALVFALLTFLIPTALGVGIVTLLFFVLGKIRPAAIRIGLPVAIALALAFSQPFLIPHIIEMKAITVSTLVIPFIAISMGVLAPYPLFQRYIRGINEYIVVLSSAAFSFFAILILGAALTFNRSRFELFAELFTGMMAAFASLFGYAHPFERFVSQTLMQFALGALFATVGYALMAVMIAAIEKK